MFFAVVVTAQAQAQAQEQLVQPYRVEDYRKFYADRLYSLNTTAPTYNAIKKNGTAIKAVDAALDLLKLLDGLVQKRKEEKHKEACNVVYTSAWTKNFRDMTPIYQIGSVPEVCNSRLDTGVAIKSNELDASISRNSRGTIVKVRDVLYDASKAIVLPNDGNWTDGMFKLVPAVRRNDGQTCSLDSVSGYFVNNNWYLRSAVTNHPPEQNIPDFNRQMIIEFIPSPAFSNQTNDQSLKMIHVRPSDGRLEKSTNVILMWGGRAYAGTMQNDDDFSDPISPISQAFRENLVHIDQASDSITISNIAILALPMVMNVVPVAFLADVTALGTLLYILLTDVLSTVPFFVKGIELMVWSQPRKEIVISFHAGDDSLRLVEVWAVRCRGEDFFTTTGIVFVAVSCIVLVGGILLEIFAKRYMVHLRKSRLQASSDNSSPSAIPSALVEAVGPFGRALHDSTATGLVGRRRQGSIRMHRAQTSVDI